MMPQEPPTISASLNGALAREETDVSGPAARAFFGIARAWGLTQGEQLKLLGLDDPMILQGWQSGLASTISPAVLERIAHLVGIFEAINTILPQPARADGWLRRLNKAPLFGGASALDKMTSGNAGDLIAVRLYLEAQCG